MAQDLDNGVALVGGDFFKVLQQGSKVGAGRLGRAQADDALLLPAQALGNPIWQEAQVAHRDLYAFTTYHAYVAPAIEHIGHGTDRDSRAFSNVQNGRVSDWLVAHPVTFSFKHVVVPGSFMLGKRPHLAPGTLSRPQARGWLASDLGGAIGYQ